MNTTKGVNATNAEIVRDIHDYLTPPYYLYDGKELTDSWADLQTKIRAGDFAGIHIGDYKTITLTTGEVVVCEVAGIDTYHKGTDTTIGHHIDFISRDCLKNTPSGKFVWNSENDNNGTAGIKNPWLASKLFQTLNNEDDTDVETNPLGVITTLPSDLQAVIIQKRAWLEERYSSAGKVSYDTGGSWQNLGKLWLPTEVEVFGTAHRSDIGDPSGGFVAYGTLGGGLNQQYPIFMGGYKHIIKGDGNGGSRCTWWELSVGRGSSTYCCLVDYTGYAHNYNASNTGITVPLCFRVG